MRIRDEAIQRILDGEIEQRGEAGTPLSAEQLAELQAAVDAGGTRVPTSDEIEAILAQLQESGTEINISDKPVLDALKGRVERGEITQSEADAIFANWKENNP